MMAEEEEEPLRGNLLFTATMVTNGNADEVSKKKTKTVEVRKKKPKRGRDRESLAFFFKKISQEYYGLFTSSVGCTSKNAGCT